MEPSSDSSLIELVKKDNHLAYTVLVDRYWEDIYRHIWMKIKNTEDAKDMVQDIFLGLWKNRLKITASEKESLGPYLFTAAKYAVINYFSRPGITIADETALSVALNVAAGIKTDDFIIANELQHVLDTEIGKLPERLQIPYRLSREQELPVKEIAQKLSLSEQTVKNNISAALNAIRFKLGKYNSEGSVIQILAIAALLHHK